MCTTLVVLRVMSHREGPEDPPQEPEVRQGHSSRLQHGDEGQFVTQDSCLCIMIACSSLQGTATR